MVRIAWFDPYSGADGEMVLGALINAGVDLDELHTLLARVPMDGYSIRAETVVSHGLSGTRVSIDVHEETTEPDPFDLVKRSELPEPARSAAIAGCEALAGARTHVHGGHSVAGSLTAAVAIAGAALGIQLLGIERVYSGSPAVGQGLALLDGETVPVPSPVTARLLESGSAPSRAVEYEAELLDPVGAAILTTLAEFQRPVFHTHAIGYGFGRHELSWPNALRLWIGEAEAADLPAEQEEGTGPAELILETTIDDMNPEFYELLVERLYEAGAVEVVQTPAATHAGRQGVNVSAVVPSGSREEVEEAFIVNSTAVSIRSTPVDRTAADQAEVTVATRWGEVRLNLKIWRGQVLEASPNIDDCLEVARQSSAPLRLVHGEAVRLGDVFVGQRMAGDDDIG